MECPVCLESFDSVNNIPASLTCGHTFCLKHNNLSVCPICRHSIPNQLHKNIALLQVLNCVVHKSQSPSGLDINSIKQLAQKLNWNEASHNKQNLMISYKNESINARINVYYNTGTVVTCLEHSYFGKTQFFQRKVNLEELKEIFESPKIHAGILKQSGYSDVEDEESLLRQQEVELESQLQTIRSQLSYLADNKEEIFRAQQQRLQEERKRLEAIRLVEEERKRLEAIRLAEEERKRIEAARLVEEGRKRLEAIRLAEEERKRIEAARLVEEERKRIEAIRLAEEERKRIEAAHKAIENRRLQARGKFDTYCLHHDTNFPTMNSCKCVAIIGDESETGYLYVSDDGGCHGHVAMSNNLRDVLKQHQFSNFDYIATGEAGQYFIRKMNGRMFWSVCRDFSDIIHDSSNGSILWVSFGCDSDTFYIQYSDGSYKCQGVDSKFYSVINNASTVDAVWLGDDYSYVISYDNGKVSYKNIPKVLQTRIQKLSADKHSIKQILCDSRTECYFIRYT